MAQKRVVVMNGQRLLQEAKAPGQWNVAKVDKAGAIKPGVYNLANAKPPENGKKYTGAIIQSGREGVYQQSLGGIIKHSTAGFSKLPEAGTLKEISYSQVGKLTASDVQPQLKTQTRSRSR